MRFFGRNRRERLAGAWVRLHRDQRGAMLDYVLVLGVICVPLFILFDKLFEVLSDYFGMIAFYVSWPFL